MPASGPFAVLPQLPGTYSTAITQGQPGGLPVPTADMVGIYATCTDLFGDKVDKVLCSAYGGNYFWQPVRPVWPNVAAMSANQDMTLFPLRTPSIIRLTGTLSAARTITPSNVNAWPGATFEVVNDATLGLFGLNIAGLALGQVLSLALGGRRRVFFDGLAWQAL